MIYRNGVTYFSTTTYSSFESKLILVNFLIYCKFHIFAINLIYIGIIIVTSFPIFYTSLNQTLLPNCIYSTGKILVFYEI